MRKLKLPLALGAATALAGGTAMLVALAPGCHSKLAAEIAPEPPISQAPPQKDLAQPISHVFVIFKENHTYDNYFASYPNPGGDPPTTSGLGKGGRVVALKEPSGDSWSPGANSWDAIHAEWDGGQMDGFDDPANEPGESNPEEVPPDGVDAAYVSYGLTPDLGRARLGYYWFLADQGVLCDRWFTSELGPSLPNHFYVLAASAGGATSNGQLSNGEFTVMDVSTTAQKTVSHLDLSRVQTALPVLLEQAGLTWTILQEIPDVPFGAATSSAQDADLAATAGLIDAVKALPDFKQRVQITGRLEDRVGEYLAKGWGAHVTFIVPDDSLSEHPGVSSIRDGQKWTQKVIDAIGQSSEWGHCAIILTWDDSGGFYDHVPPPQIDAFGPGFRVPCLVIGPYAKRGVVDHTVREHSSVAKLCETLFGLPTMTNRDAAADDLMGAFDLTQDPRPYSDFAAVTGTAVPR